MQIFCKKFFAKLVQSVSLCERLSKKICTKAGIGLIVIRHILAKHQSQNEMYDCLSTD